MQEPNLPDHLTLMALEHSLNAPIGDIPQRDISITEAGFTYSDPHQITYTEYAISKGLDPSNPLTIIRATNTVECDRVLNELEGIEPKLEHLSDHVSALKEELVEANAQYRAKIKTGEYPTHEGLTSSSKKLQRQKRNQKICILLTGAIALVEGAQVFPALLASQSFDPSNLAYAFQMSPALVMSSILFSVVCSFVFWGLGKQLVEQVDQYSLYLKSLSRVPLLSHLRVAFWVIAYGLFVWALADLRQSLLAGTDQDAHSSLFILTALVPIISAVILGKISIDVSLVQEVEAWDISQETCTRHKQEYEAYVRFLQEEHDQASNKLNTLIARKNTLLDRAQEAEEHLRKAYLQERTATITSGRKGALDLHTAKLDYQRQHIARAEAERHQARNHQRQTSMAHIIELAKAST